MKKPISFNDCIADCLFCNNHYKPVLGFDFSAYSQKTAVYEIIRVINGVPLFWEDHWRRIQVSAENFETIILPDEEVVIQQIETLLGKCYEKELNIKLIAFEGEKAEHLIYFSRYYYPNEIEYAKGITASFLHAERDNPNVKTFLPVRDMALKRIDETKSFDVILVNNNGIVTEGSRTNFFVLKNKNLYTALPEKVLKGITRKYILSAAEELQIKHIEMDFDESFVYDADACFFSGTSPKILPVSSIDNYQFDVKNTELRNLMDQYNSIINNYILSKQTIA